MPEPFSAKDVLVLTLQQKGLGINSVWYFDKIFTFGKNFMTKLNFKTKMATCGTQPQPWLRLARAQFLPPHVPFLTTT